MPRKTVQQLNAYIKATTVVYDHSNTKLISGKTKVKPRRKQTFLSVLHYGKTSSDDCCAKSKPSKRRISRQLRCPNKSRSHAGKQKLQIFVRTPVLHTPKTLCFRLDPGTSISSLKEWIQKKIGVEARYQRLYIKRNFQLCDLLTLEDNGIEKDENISLRLSFDGLLGGGPKERAQFDQFLWDIATKIESTWKEVAKNLEFEEADIGEIQAKNKDDSREQSMAMLFTWWSKQKKSREASQKLREALEASGLADLALKVPDQIDISYQDQGNQVSDDIATSAAAAADHKTSKQEEEEVTEMIAVEKTLPDRTRMEQDTGKPDMSQPETRPVGEFKDPSSKPPSAASLDQLVLGERQVGAQHGPVEQQLVDVTVSTSSERMIDSAELQSCSEEKHMTRTRETPELEQGDDSHLHSPKHLATIPPGQRLHESVEYVRITQPLTTLAVEEMEPNNRHAMSSPEQERLRQETDDPTGHQSQKQQLAGQRNLVSPEQMKHGQVSSSNSESLASSAPQTSTSSASAVQKYGSNGSKQVSVDLNVGGSYDPIFLAPVTNTTVNFIQNVNVTGKSPEFPKVSIETDVTRQGCKDSGMTDILWTAMTNLCKTHGSDYLLEQVSACLKPYGIELEHVQSGSVTFVVRILSREGLNKLWSMYTTGELARKLTEIILTDELITEDKSDLAIQATVLESDYEQACRFFDNLERDQQKDEEDSGGMAEVHHTQLDESSTTTSAYNGDPAEHAADRCNKKLKTLYMTTEEEDSRSEMTEVQHTQPGESSTATLSSSSDPAELAADRCTEKPKTLCMTTDFPYIGFHSQRHTKITGVSRDSKIIDSSSEATTVQMTGAAVVCEQLVDITDQRTTNLFSELLSKLAKELTGHELQHVRILCSHQGVPAEELETDDAMLLLRVLEKNDLIGKDKTQFLKKLLEIFDLSAGIDFVKEYEEKRRKHLQNVEILLGKHDPFFVGRTTFVSRILEVFCDQSHDKCRCVLVYGLAGTGKTKLAVESCTIYKEQARCGTRLLRVNLRKATSMEEVGLWILNTVTGKQITQRQFDIALVKKWIMNCLEDTVLLLDYADDILNPLSHSKDHFVNTLSELLSISNRRVKFIFTSRHPVDFMGLRELPNFMEVKLEPLRVVESLQLLTKMFGHAKKLYETVSDVGKALHDEESLLEIAKLCGNNPLALRAVASRLNSGFSPRSLVEFLKCPEGAQRVLDPGSLGASQAVQDERKDFEDQPFVLNSLGAMFEQLSQSLKESLLKLSVFPSSFSLSQGAEILGKKPSDAVIKFDLEDLKRWSLLERDDYSIHDIGLSNEEPYYFMNPLVRSVCLSKIGSSGIYKAAYEEALRRFIAYIADLLEDLTQLGQRDFASALPRLESNKTNVLHYLELGMGTKFGCQNTAEQENTASVVPLPETMEGLFSIFEIVLDPSKRLEYYTNMSIRMLRSGSQEAWAFLRGWMADELYVRAKYDEAWNAVEEPLKVLKARASDPAIGRTNDLERAEAHLLYVKGRILVARRKYNDGIAVLEQALKIQEHLLGNHSLTARCLNGLGHAYFNKSDDDCLCDGVTEANEYHLKAWDMLVKITNDKPEKHFDAPMYLLNIGATFHQMGKQFIRSNKKKAHEYFTLAIKNYHEAYDLERALKLSNSPNTAFVLKNMAVSYCEMEEYEKALSFARGAVTIREETIGVHPTTARNLFFIGSLYDSIGDEYKKSKKPEDKTKSQENYKLALEYYNRAFEMEVQLGPSNHSIEYDDLKEDLQNVLRKLHMNKELDKYRRMFKAADTGTPDVGDMSMNLRSGSGQPSPSIKRSPDRMDATDVRTGTSDDDEMAGQGTQRAGDTGTPDLGDMSMDLRYGSGQASPSKKRSPDRMDATDVRAGTSADDEVGHLVESFLQKLDDVELSSDHNQIR